MMDRSGLTHWPPLKPATGVSMSNGAISMAMPWGGRPLVMANLMPARRKSRTRAMARSVSTFSLVTSVPSTSARKSLMAGMVFMLLLRGAG